MVEVEAQVEDYFSPPKRPSRVGARGLLTGRPMRFSAGSGTRDMRHRRTVRYCYGIHYMLIDHYIMVDMGNCAIVEERQNSNNGILN